MKRFLFFPLLVLFSMGVSAQSSSDSNRVEWSYAVHSINDSLFELHFKATLQEGWRLFSVTMPEDMPRTNITLDTASGQSASLGSINEAGKLQSEKDPLLDAPVSYFEKEVTLSVPLSIRKGTEIAEGTLSYMAYKGDQFVGPFEVPFRFSISAGGIASLSKGGLQAATASVSSLKKDRIDLTNPVNSCGGTGAEGQANSSLWTFFVLGFAGGLLGLLMPCTFPMIPLTVSFFTKQSADRKKAVWNASLYGFFIFLIYVVISLPFYFLDSSSSAILNNISTNAWLNLFFAAVFLVFALSFFGLYEITLPGNMANKVGAKSGARSLAGTFFMALTLAIVSFSCTGPILGSLLVGALNQQGGAVQLTAAMAGFGLALGLPFALFALFPRWLHSLPRSGSWMNTLKIVFGFVELALMLKFLSNADLVMHWGIVPREVFIGLWVLISLATSLYLFGILKFRHDPPPAKLSVGRKLLATLFLIFAIYLIPGLTNTRYANLSLVSGFPPPLQYSVYGHESASEKGLEANVVNDYEAALALAKKENKPLLIDFTGWACVNCRKMEENVWTDPGVSKLIKDNFVLVSLYVDDRALLKKEDQFLFTARDGSKKEIRTIGDKYSTLQSENFGNASQPLYAIISPDEKLLNLPVGYTPSIKEYTNWLSCGRDAFDKAKPANTASSF